MGDLPADNHNEDRRTNSLNNPHTPFNITRSLEASNFGSIQNFGLDSSREGSANVWDPLSVLIPVTDGVLIITAIIFIVALGFVALIVVMAIIKVYFMKDELESIWVDDWFWPD